MSTTPATQKTYFTPFLVTLSEDLSSREEVVSVLNELVKTKVPAEALTVLNLEKKSITIGMVRELVAELSYASLQGKDRHIVLLNVDQFTIEAQNAVLKLLEEPPTRTQFWLFTQHPQQLLPTITSRTTEVSFRFAKNNSSTEPSQENEAVQVLLKDLPSLSYRELIEMAEKYQDRQKAQDFCDEAIKLLHQSLNPTLTQANLKAISTILETKQHLSANVSPKLALEHCFFELKQLLT